MGGADISHVLQVEIGSPSLEDGSSLLEDEADLLGTTRSAGEAIQADDRQLSDDRDPSPPVCKASCALPSGTDAPSSVSPVDPLRIRK
jgi:hypothetical protein